VTTTSRLLSSFSLFVFVLLLITPRASLGQDQEYTRARTDPPEEHPLFWRDRLISYVIDSEGCPDADMGHTRAAVIRSFNTWESQPCTDLFFAFQGYTEGVQPNHFTDVVDGRNLIIWTYEWPPEWGEERVANTRVLWNERNGEILDVDIVLNARDYYWTASDRTITDIENVMVHEIGHLLGFEHTTDPEASMYLGYTDGEILKRDLSGTDIRGLCEVYPSGRPTPDVPDLGLDDIELSSGGCQCRVAPRNDVARGRTILLLLLGTTIGFLRRRP